MKPDFKPTNKPTMKTTAHIHSLSSNLIPLILLGSVFSNANAASITSVGVEEGGAGNSYSVQNWSNAGVAKGYDLGGTEKYGTGGYYQIRPMPWDPGSANINQAASAGNDLGTSAGSNPTLYSAPSILSSLTGAAGTYVNYGGYGIYRGPDGDALYRAGGLSVSVNQGPYNTPSGSNNGKFGEAFSFTMGMSATFRMGIAADSVGSGQYAPDYMSIYNSGTGSVFSSALTRNGSADMAFFDIDAAAGDTFTAAMWQRTDSVIASPSVAPFSLITFDVSQYKFDVAGGNSTSTNSNVISGAAAGISKTGNGTQILSGNNTYAGNTTVSAGRLAVDNGNALGSTAAGTTVASGAQLYLNGVTVGNESLTISGTGLSDNTTSFFAGAIRSANGTSNTLQGKVNLAADARIFTGTSTSLTVDVASGDAINLGAFNLNIDGAGTHTVNDAIVGTGGLVKSGSGITTLSAVNSYSGATDIQAGRVVLSGAGRLNSGAISVANASTGTLEFAVTGTNTMANNISGNGSLLSSSGETRFTGAVTSTGGLTINSNSAVRIGNGGATGSYSGSTVLGNSAAQLIFDRSDSYTHAGDISGNGSVVIAGAGTTTFTGAKTYTGLTTVSLGTLAVNGSVAGAMSVVSGATLQGNGTISGATTVSGNLKPGNSPGLLTFANSLTLESSATTTMEITGANSSGTRGTTYDAVNVGSALTYGGALALNFDTLFTQNGNYTFNLFDFGSTSGSFGSVSLAGVYSGSFINTSGIWGLTQGDNNWSFNQGDGVLSFTVIPEPNVAMVAGSLVLMAMLRRRRD
jgi:autotransporter-associated beta strand protein